MITWPVLTDREPRARDPCVRARICVRACVRACVRVRACDVRRVASVLRSARVYEAWCLLGISIVASRGERLNPGAVERELDGAARAFARLQG